MTFHGLRQLWWSGGVFSVNRGTKRLVMTNTEATEARFLPKKYGFENELVIFSLVNFRF